MENDQAHQGQQGRTDRDLVFILNRLLHVFDSMDESLSQKISPCPEDMAKRINTMDAEALNGILVVVFQRQEQIMSDQKRA